MLGLAIVKRTFAKKAMMSFVQDLPQGVAASLDWVPRGILVLEDYLDAASHAWRTDYFDKQTAGVAQDSESRRVDRPR
ncbi:MAG: hypothetical protein HRT77_11800 [Halioglobus sp.]|nr:hypothetical protein [Halioglobus sp.]